MKALVSIEYTKVGSLLIVKITNKSDLVVEVTYHKRGRYGKKKLGLLNPGVETVVSFKTAKLNPSWFFLIRSLRHQTLYAYETAEPEIRYIPNRYLP